MRERLDPRRIEWRRHGRIDDRELGGRDQCSLLEQGDPVSKVECGYTCGV